MPSAAMRVAFLAAWATPFLRKYSTAFTMSPPHSCSAFLQSDMPAWVRSRRSLIIWVEISLISIVSCCLQENRDLLLALVLGGCGRLWLGHVAAPARHDLDPRSLTARRHADGLHFALALALGVRGRGPLTRQLLAEDAGIGHLVREQADGPNGVVVARNGVLDQVRVAVAVHHGHDRDLQLARLAHRDVLLDHVDDEHRARQLAHGL